MMTQLEKYVGASLFGHLIPSCYPRTPPNIRP